MSVPARSPLFHRCFGNLFRDCQLLGTVLLNPVHDFLPQIKNLSYTSEEQEKCVIIAINYGFAGAINYYGEKYDLPKSLNFNGSFYRWGPGELPGDIFIAIGFEEKHFENWCDNIEVADIAKFELARESEVPIYLCRNPQLTMPELWPRIAKYRF